MFRGGFVTDYTFGTTTTGDFEDVLERVTAALAAEGFGVLTTIDVAATMKAKLDADMAPYRILGACNPPLAQQAITTEPQIGALLPCNVVVRQTEGGVAVDFMDPAAVLTLVDKDGIEVLAAEVSARLHRVAAAI
jgi:uncharacterized protein (DUF302 family)